MPLISISFLDVYGRFLQGHYGSAKCRTGECRSAESHGTEFTLSGVIFSKITQLLF